MVTIPLLFQLSLTLIFLTERLVEPCHTLIDQPAELTALTTDHSTSLPCPKTHLCRTAVLSTIRWFMFRQNSYREIRAQHPKYSMDDMVLTIYSPQINDSGVYYCSIVPSSLAEAPSVGNGTRLVVRERHNASTPVILPWTLFAVLAAYSLLILVLLVSKKARREIFRSQRRNSRDKRGSTRRLRFHAVVQELYGKRNLRSTAQSTMQTQPRRSRIEHPQAYSRDEDVYQNM